MLALGVAAWTTDARRVERTASASPRCMALSLMTALLSHYFLRGNLAARFGDMGPPLAVLAAYLLSMSTTAPGASIGGLAHGGRRGTGDRRPRDHRASARGVWPASAASCGPRGCSSRATSSLARGKRLRSLARDARVAAGERGGRSHAGRRLSAPMHAPDRSRDRVGYAPDVPGFSERLFAGGARPSSSAFTADERYCERDGGVTAIDSLFPSCSAANCWTMRGCRLIVNYLRSHYDGGGDGRDSTKASCACSCAAALPGSRLVLAAFRVSDDVRRTSPRRCIVDRSSRVLLFAWVFLYRFNTLGGALGGFDNDHFLYMTLAKQVAGGRAAASGLRRWRAWRVAVADLRALRRRAAAPSATTFVQRPG